MAELTIHLDYPVLTNQPDFDDRVVLENQDEEAVAMMDESPAGGIGTPSFIIEIFLHVMLKLFQHCFSFPVSVPMWCYYCFHLATLTVAS